MLARRLTWSLILHLWRRKVSRAMKPVSLVLSFAVLCVARTQGQTVDNPLRVGGDVKPPVLVKQVRPKYPRPLFGERKEASVLVYLIVDENGIPSHLSVRRSAGRKFDNAALDAVDQYRFTPATKEDKPVAVEINVDISFKLF